MLHQSVIDTQLEFYRKGGAGCLFAAHAASDPEKYQWRLSVSRVDTGQIESIVQEAIEMSNVSTQSIIFPSVLQEDEFKNLLLTIHKVSSFFLEQEHIHENMMCLGFRVRIGDKISWLTGIAGFSFLPKTRQAVFTEIVFRCKPRPDYEKVMKRSSYDILHLADMDMKGMSENKFKSLWYGSLDNTEKVLGHKPDLRSAAKTTFTVPIQLWQEVKVSL